MNALENHSSWVIFIFAILMLGLGGQFIDVSIMEARNFITAREMFDDGNWILTTLNGEPRYQKPPLPSWLTAIMYAIFGSKTFALRLPAILMSVVLGITAMKLSRKMGLKPNHSFVNGLITISSFYILGIVIEAPWDIFAHGFMLIGIYHLYQLFQLKENFWKHTLLSGLFIGFSILSKGPISIYALLLPFLIAYALKHSFKIGKAKVFSAFSVLLIAVAVGSWWYLYVRWMDPEAFNQITKQETSNWGSYNVRPFYYYWSFFTQSGVWTILAFVGLLYPYLKNKVVNRKLYVFTLIWTVGALFLLSIIPEKKSRYLMPVLIPLALNTGFYVDFLIRRIHDLRPKHRLVAQFNFILIGVIAFSTPFIFYLYTPSIEFKIISVLIIGLCSIYAGYQMIRKAISKDILQCVYLVLPVLIIIGTVGAFTNQSRSAENYQSLKGFQSYIKDQGIPVFSLSSLSPELLWEYGEQVEVLQAEQLEEVTNLPQSFYMIMDEDDAEMGKLKNYYDISTVAKFDLNRVEPDSRSYKNRLTRQVYRFVRK